jgi:Nif-specific regulatory protein
MNSIITGQRNKPCSGKLLEALSKLSELMEAMVSEDQVYDRVLELLVMLFGAERGAIFLWDFETDGLKVAKTYPSSFQQDQITLGEAKVLSQSSALSAMEEGEVIFTNTALIDERFAKRQSVVLNRIQTLLCAPLKVGGEVIGAIYMDSRKLESMFEETDRPFFKTVSNLVSTAIEKSREFRELRERTEALKKGCPQEMIGNSEPMIALYSEMRRAAPTKASVLILGESGTGKDLLACAIHRLSPRREKNFVAVDCGSVPETLLESELFGYKKGAFTGAFADKPGLFEEADGGTVFMDEITSASLSVQSKLLRSLQEGEIRRLGENKPRKVDVRLICATNADLEEEVKAKRFRRDLYFRLKVVSLKIPPLRERGSDILLLSEHFRKVYAARYGKPVRGFTRDTARALLKFQWEGNVRELQHAVERGVIMSQGRYLSLSDLEIPALIAEGRSSYRETLESQRRAMVEKALGESKGSVSQAATILGMAPRQLNRLMKRFGILGQKGRGRPKVRSVS